MSNGNDSLLTLATQYRDLILLLEIAGWLHDVGKLSEKFINSITLGPHWNHANILQEEIIPGSGLYDLLRRNLTGEGGWLKSPDLLDSQTTNIWDLIEKHHSKTSFQLTYCSLLDLLIKADQSESAEEEGIASGRQVDALKVQRATVFGKETLMVDHLSSLNEYRKQGFDFVSEQLMAAPNQGFPKIRNEIWTQLSSRFSKGMGKTQRAVNDIRLDQHAWGVATRFKALALQETLRSAGKEVDDPGFFRLLSIWWNSWEIITPFARLVDSLGREQMIEQIRKRLREMIEVNYALGSPIYEDADGIHFLVAGANWLPEIEPLMREAIREISDGEVQATIILSEPTLRVTDLTRQLVTASQSLPWVDINSNTDESQSHGIVCPICHRHILAANQVICNHCATWRKQGAYAGRERRTALGGTPWTGELADSKGRVALMVACFDLEHWLDGSMLHTIFATSPSDVASGISPSIPLSGWTDLRNSLNSIPENFFKSDPKNYESHKKNLQIWSGNENSIAGKVITARYDRLDRVIRNSPDISNLLGVQNITSDARLLALIRKPPTAGRLLRVWQTCDEFFTQQANHLNQRLERRLRLEIRIDQELEMGFYSAALPDAGKIEFFLDQSGQEGSWLQSTSFLSDFDFSKVSHLVGQTLSLVPSDQSNPSRIQVRVIAQRTKSYLPVKPALISPNLALIYLPADQAITIAEAWRRAYMEEFGKVQGRLPFHIGLIFMDQHYPAFAALDTARRLSETFNTLSDEPMRAFVKTTPEVTSTSIRIHLEDENGRFSPWTWDFPTLLGGDPHKDWYHPYLLVRSGEGLDQRPASIEGPGGRWLHLSEIQMGDLIEFQPDLFDFIFLDTITRRLDALPQQNRNRRPHDLLKQDSPRPYLLENLPLFIDLWNKINFPEMTSTCLQGAASLLAGRVKSWGRCTEEFQRLAEWVANRDFAGNADILSAIQNGMFFDVIELYRHILKLDLSQPVDAALTQVDSHSNDFPNQGGNDDLTQSI